MLISASILSSAKTTVTVVAVTVVLLFSQSAWASCGDYLHTRFSRPTQHFGMNPAEGMADSSFSEADPERSLLIRPDQGGSLDTSAGRLLAHAFFDPLNRDGGRPCSGPGCERSSDPLSVPVPPPTSSFQDDRALFNELASGVRSVSRRRLCAHEPSAMACAGFPLLLTEPPDCRF